MNRKRWGLVGGVVLVGLVGLMVLTLRDPEEATAASFHAGKINAANNTSTMSSYSSSNHGLFLARRIAVISESEHPVIKRTTRNLAAALGELHFVEEVDVFTDDRPESGEPLYDLYVMIEMPKFESRGLLATGRKVNAEIKCSISRGFWNSRHSHNDHLSPPLVNPHMEIELEHKSTAWGVETPNIRFHQVGKNLSEQVVGQATKSLTELAGKFRTPENLPAGLYPAYHPRPELPAPWNERLVEVVNGPGFMLRNQSIFTMSSTRPYEDLNSTREMLKERGWKLDPKNFKRRDERDFYYYRATFDNLVSEAFEARDYGPRATNEPVRLVFRYYDRMTRAEVAAAFQEAYGDEIPMELWLSFQNVLPKETNERTLEKLASRSTLPAAAEKEVIRHLDKTGRGEAARARLRPAYFAALIENDDQAEELLKLGRALMDDKKWKPAELTVADLEAMNIPRAEPGSPFEVEVALNESARYHVGPEDAFEIWAISVKRAEIPEGRYMLACGSYSLGRGGRGSSGVTPHGTNTPWKAMISDHAGGIGWSVSAEEIGDERFKLTIEGRE